MKRPKIWIQILAVPTVLTFFLILLFYNDNKYQTPPPYGSSGIMTLDEEDLERKDPIFLIDGWLLSDERVTDRPTYIGEFSNLQRGDLSVSPHGHARYRLTLRYHGTPRIVAIDFPRLSSRYKISLDGIQLAQGVGSERITFLLTAGDHILIADISSKTGYYSGMYFPPALGTAETLLRIGNAQILAYAAAFLIPSALAVFTLFLWKTGGSIARWSALLCCCYAFYMFRYFVFLLSYSHTLPIVQYWPFVQDLAMYCLCSCTVQLTGLASGADHSRTWKRMRTGTLALPALLSMLYLLIPILPWAVYVHSKLTDIYYISTFLCTIYPISLSLKAQGWADRYTLAACSIFGAGLVANLFCSNRFEPIRFFWQFEWCGLLLILLFGAMMISRDRRILRENNILTHHLEEQVEKRTKEVTQLLEERKAFFSDMAHDLKAPVFATQSFIRAIRRSGVGVDTELQGYLDQAEAKQWEMARRLQGLSTINAFDKIEGERVQMSLQEILSDVYDTYHGEAQVRSVYLFVEPPDNDASLKIQPEKLNILFENLIYNALRATPCNGRITISAWVLGDDKICLAVEDTGCGIPKEELPFIFHRFYVGARNKGTGTGLGLYIVHSIVTELGGTIDVSSAIDKGTRFVMTFPRAI